MAFCGRANGGQMIGGQFVGHVWPGLDDELVDFSCGDCHDPRGELQLAGIELPPVQWQARPPTFVCATRDQFIGSHGEPPIGDLWYRPLDGHQT